jgi:hypothetical protein
MQKDCFAPRKSSAASLPCADIVASKQVSFCLISALTSFMLELISIAFSMKMIKRAPDAGIIEVINEK